MAYAFKKNITVLFLQERKSNKGFKRHDDFSWYYNTLQLQNKCCNRYISY
jgi:hypothetical protein